MIRYSPDGYWALIDRYWVRLSDGLRLPVIQGGGPANTVQNDKYAFGDDDNNEATHTLDTENTPRTTQTADVTFMFRVQIEETNGGTESAQYQLYAAKNGGTAAAIPFSTTNDGLRLNDDTQSRADNETTTERLSYGGASAFQSGLYDDGTSVVGTETNISLDQDTNGYTDLEFALYIDSANASDSDYWDLEVRFNGGGSLDGYPGTLPRVTASITAPLSVSLNTAQLNASTSNLSVSPSAASVSTNSLELISQVEDVVVSAETSTLSLDSLLLNANAYARQAWTFPWIDGFESGDISAWDGNFGSITINTGSAIIGTYGAEFDVTLTRYVTKYLPDSSSYRFSFYLNTNDAAGSTDDRNYLVRVFDNNFEIGRLALYYSSGFNLQAEIRDDGSGWNVSSLTSISSATNLFIEIEWVWENNTGHVRVWVDDVEGNGVSDIDSGTHIADEVRFGNTLFTALDSGTIYLDHFTVNQSLRPIWISPLTLLSSPDNISISITTELIVSLNSLSLLSEIPQLTVSPGAATVSLNTASIQSTPISLTVSPGTSTVSLNTGQITSQVPNASVSAGATTVSLDTLILNGTPIGLSLQTAGADIVSLNTLSLSVSAQHIRIQPEALVYVQHPISRRYPYISKILSGQTSVAPAIPPQTVALQTLQLLSQIGNISVVAGAATVQLDTAQLNAIAINLTVTPGTATIALDSLLLQSNVISLSVVAGTATISLSTLELNALVQNLTVFAGVATISLNTVQIQSNVISLTIDAPSTISLDSLQLQAIPVSLIVTPGTASISLDTLKLNVSAVPLNVALGAAAVILNSIQLTSQIIPLQVVAGTATISLDTLILQTTPINLAVVPGSAIITLDTLQLGANVISLSVVAGTATIQLDTLELLATPIDLQVVAQAVSIALDSLGLDVTAVPLSVTLGAVAVILESLQLISQIEPLDVITAILMDSLQLTATAPQLDVVPSSVTTTLDTLELNANAQPLTVVLGAATVSLNTAQLISNIISLNVSAGAVTTSLDSLILTSEIPDLSVIAGTTTISLDSLLLESYIDNIDVEIEALIPDTLGLDITAVPLTVVPGAVSQTLDTLKLNVIAVALGSVFLSPAVTLAGCIDISDELISDILVEDEAISVVSLTDELISQVTITDTCEND